MDNDEEIDLIVNDFIISRNYITNIQGNKLYTINDLKKCDSFLNQMTFNKNISDII